MPAIDTQKHTKTKFASGEHIYAHNLGHAVEKALARTVDKHGSIMSDRFELHKGTNNTHTRPYNLHFIYKDPDTKAKAVRIFYGLPREYEGEEFKQRMGEIKAWITLLGQYRKNRLFTERK